MVDKTDMEERLTLYKDDYESDSQNRKEALEDLEFIAGNQWNEKDRAERELAQRPVITVNKMPTFIRQVVGDAQQNKPSISVSADSMGASEEIADIHNGIIRGIQRRAENTNPYITAVEQAASCGIGHFRIVSEYLPDNPFHQELSIRPIYNPLGVVWDANAKAKDRSDAKHCHSLTSYTRKAFEKKYRGEEVLSFDSLDDLTRLWHPSQDLVNVAEVFSVEEEKTIYGLTNQGRVLDLEHLPPLLHFDELNKIVVDRVGNEYPIIEMKTANRSIVKWERMTAASVLETGQWVTSEIPIIPIIGGEIHFENQSYRSSLIRWAKDPQRLYNFWRSAQTELIGNAPKQPFIIGQSQIAGHAAGWINANRGNQSALIFNDTDNSNTPKRQHPPTSSTGFQQEIAMASEDMKTTTGIFDASLGASSNETSGVAIRQRQMESDVATSHFSFNMTASLKRAGQILVNAIPHIYDTSRVLRILGEDDTGKTVEVNSIAIENGVASIYNDLTIGRYDVAVNVGPSFATRRQESLELLKSMLADNPQLTMNFLDILFDLADIPNAELMKKRARKLMPPGLVEGDDKDSEQVDPMQQQQAAMQQQLSELEMRLKTAETTEKEAKAKKANAEADNEAVSTALKKIELSERAGIMPPGAAEIFKTIMSTPADQITAQPTQQPQNAFA